MSKKTLNTRSLNNAIFKNKYQMPNLESLLEKMAGIVNAKEEGEVFLTSLDMQYAYGHTVLHPDTTKHRNFQILGEESAGTYSFNAGFYGLTVMPPEIQRIINYVVQKKKEHIHSLRRHFNSHEGDERRTSGNSKRNDKSKKREFV